ncbi:MAG: response regulator [Calditrichaeota bacterium]|nr:response regulator [Calditrichota bacterium]
MPQDQNFRFEPFRFNDELAGKIVYSILQDHLGFIWIGTNDGLFKYNGYKLTAYKNDRMDTTSLGNNDVIPLYEDIDRTLWFGTSGGGVNRFDRENEQFIRMKHNPVDSNTINNDVIRSFFQDSHGIMWIGTWNGLNKYDPFTGKVKHYLWNGKSYQPDKHFVWSITEDHEGIIWIGTGGDGLKRYDAKSDSFKTIKTEHGFPDSMTTNSVRSVFEDSRGTLWIGTTNGLYRYDNKKNRFKRFYFDFANPYSLTSNFISAICEDRHGRIWIGTDKGLNRFENITERFYHFLHDPEDNYSLVNNYVTNLRVDKAGSLWISTINGISRIDFDRNRFFLLGENEDDPKSVLKGRIGAIYEDRQETLWIGAGSGLGRLDKGSKKIKYYKHNENDKKSISSNYINTILEDQTGTLWIGTDNGLNSFNRETSRFTHYYHDPEDSTTLTSNNVLSVKEDNNGNLWAGTFDVAYSGGLNLFNRKTNKFKRYYHDPENENSLSASAVWSLNVSKSGKLWIATPGSGINLFDPKTESFKRKFHIDNDLSSLSHNWVGVVYEDHAGILWATTWYSGLNKLDQKTGKFKVYTESDGLRSNQILGILEDNNGYLWLGTNTGLCRFDPKQEKFKNFNIEGGIRYNWNTNVKRKNGSIYFGGSYLVYFNPDSIKDNPFIPPVVITGFQRIKQGKKEGKPIVEKGISGKKNIELSYDDRTLIFEFSALNYINTENNLYKYKLDGFDDNWIDLGTKHDVTFTNLDPGEYTLYVKGSNNDGVWNKESTSLKIYIAPPWWRTNWAYGFYFLTVVSVLLGIRAYELKRQRLKYELEMEHEQAEILKETDQMKSRFFASISHEFRTPLTLINGPVDRLIASIKETEHTLDLKRIKDNATHISKLVEMYLDLSQLESGNLKLQKEKLDIIPLLRVVHASFESRAEAEQKKLLFNTHLAAVICNIDEKMLALVMNNLLSNALKFTPAGGEIIVSVASKPTPGPSKEGSTFFPSREGVGVGIRLSESVQITVSDTGIGIPEDQQSRVFDMYFQVDNEINKRLSGTGIGLAMVKELVAMHDGTVSVESSPQQGTIFTIELPLIEATEILQQIGQAEKVEYPENTEEDISAKDEAEEEETILIVEDNYQMLDYIKSHLKNDYKTVTAPDGKKGFEIALKSNPHLIISDVMMPEMDGYELCTKLKQDFRTSHIPVILLTAKTEDKDMLTGLQTGADAYLKKPFKEQELQVRIRNLIENRERLHRKFITEKQLDYKAFNITSADERFLEQCNKVVENNISNEQFSVEEFAEEIALSRVQLHRKLKALTGLSTSNYIKTIRLKKAALLLESGFGNISEIAYECGFSNHSNFSESFKKMYNLSPKEYASKHKKPEL